MNCFRVVFVEADGAERVIDVECDPRMPGEDAFDVFARVLEDAVEHVTQTRVVDRLFGAWSQARLDACVKVIVSRESS